MIMSPEFRCEFWGYFLGSSGTFFNDKKNRNSGFYKKYFQIIIKFAKDR